MPLNRPYRFITLLMLLMLAVVGSSAQAQTALPQIVGEVRVGTPDAISPNTTDYLNAGRMFLWTNVSAVKYVLKLKIVENGKLHVVRLNAADITCEINCRWIAVAADPLFALTKDGQTVKWKVVAKFADGSKTKSANQTTYVDETATPVLNAVAFGAVLQISDTFNWLHYAVNTNYAMVIVDADTKVVVYNGPILAASCASTCTYAANLVWGSLSFGEGYQWHIRGYGATGEKAKSEKRIFTMPPS